MKLVVEIDEETYKDIKKGKVYSSIRDVPQESVLAIANGTPLPKGHGRLKDENEIKRMIENANVNSEHSKTFAENIIRFTSTIIEADKMESDG